MVELIVVIAIIAALSISMGVSTVETLKSTRYKTYRETYKNILDAGKFYAKLKKNKREIFLNKGKSRKWHLVMTTRRDSDGDTG